MQILDEMGPQPDSYESKRFITYFNYIVGLAIHLDQEYHDPNDLITLLTQSKSFNQIKRSKGSLVSETQKLLRHAWFTEIQFSEMSNDADFLRYANHWSPVQLYYAVYLAIRALFAASRRKVGETHQATLNQIPNDIKNKPDLFPSPWKVTCIGDSEKKTEEYLNLPKDVTIDRGHSPLKSPANTYFWDSYCQLLRTTRQRKVDVAVSKWKKGSKNTRIPPAERLSIVTKMPSTTIFDFLYRLRIRSNYEDADSFLMSYQSDSDAHNFHWALGKICWYTMLIIETVIRKYIGEHCFVRAVTDFTNRVTVENSPIEKRWTLLSVTL